ncbi:MAG: DUF3631 domain-containing protein [Nitrospirae bacterium]|nr:DUF3631 domain-containing protein [Nitrospirota bacterium]
MNQTKNAPAPSGSNQQTTNSPLLADLLEEISDLINKYVKLPHPSLGILLACWVALTYCYQNFQYCGYVALQSATRRCGKSRLIKLMRFLVNGTPPISTIPTPANLYRSPHKVILLDEVDKLRNCDKDKYGEVVAVLNLGFEKGGTIQRLERRPDGNFVQKDFDVYGPKLLAGIEGLADTLADRSFFIRMARSPQRPPRINTRRLEATFDTIRQSLEQWLIQHDTTIEQVYDELPDEVPELAKFDDRFQDIAEPLMVLASLADAELAAPNGDNPLNPTIKSRLLSAFAETAKQRTPSGQEEAFLAFLSLGKRLLNGRDQLFLPSAEMVIACEQIEELDWINHSKKLATFLRPFDLSPQHDPTGSYRGYILTEEWVQEWTSRYQT